MRRSTRCYVGVDGGGSKTTCAVADETGRILGRATGGASNYHAIGIEAASTRVAELIVEALRGVSVERSDEVEIAGACLALAGVARPEDERAWRGALESIIARPPVSARWELAAADVVLTHDAMAALVGGTGRRLGVVIIAGTGAIAFGVNARGEQHRASGWGYLLGDEGSGYWLGLAGLRAVCRGDDGRGPETALTGTLLAARGLARPQDLVRAVYSEWKPADVASLAPLVLAAAAEGDAAAGGIVEDAAAELAAAAVSVLRRLDLIDTPVEVVTAGSLWDGPSLLRDCFAALVRERAPRPAVIAPRAEPVAGAILLARKAA